ncbi:hypothetical protein [Bacillus suaedaesalsae]|uniref:Arylamine N-acetyltransferase n=1 Tax=Bacillus suaedaesalsae TaxID=2810349 RepID=A0ABS2DJW7_9BACI|nr:hypothetical protein [Bacillus suaedaesalsae]MBM6618764.1 hypothetical protein [Bacillus suaedaesalsae]
MKAPNEILSVWNQFNSFPMETLTKVWYFEKGGSQKQRDVSLMKEHYEQFGITGNCFDLAIWLLDEFKQAGVKAYSIGHDLHTPEAHVGVIAVCEKGNRYLCDLGDQWIQPILIDCEDENFRNDRMTGYFPAADVQIEQREKDILVHYYRPNGKVSRQTYDTTPIESNILLQAAEFSQNHIKQHPLLECRIPYKNEIAHFEFYNFESFLSTSEGKFYDEPLHTIEEWATRISEKTGYDAGFVLEALSIYQKLR